MDFDIKPYDLAGGAGWWLILLGILLAIGVVISLALALARNGSSGIQVFGAGLMSYLRDIFSISVKRIYALTRLTLLEAIRRKALLVFVVFAMLLMVAGWYLSDANERPELQARVYVTFLFTAISWLILPAIIFLSCWALPEDIRIRSLHTVVTKPARRIEIVIGRMLGMSVVALVFLGIMGGIGFFWINRLLPDSTRSFLTCRVPVFGMLYFIDADGQPAATGINVGDVWMYRSNIEGNSRARAVWLFRDIDESAIVRGKDDQGRDVDGLKMECRFEAFRTIKGSEKSVLQGVQAQYTISSNPREDAFGMISQTASLRSLADALRDGQFKNASALMKDLSARIRSESEELREADYAGLQNGLAIAASVLREQKNERILPVAEMFEEAAVAGFEMLKVMGRNILDNSSVEIPYATFADKIDVVATGLADYAEDLHEALPKLEVPLPSFHISEYHDGDITMIPRKLRFAADYETQARFLAGIIEEWNAAGRLADGEVFKAALTDDLTKDAGISPLNAELLVTVLNEQVAGGSLTLSDGKVAVADGKRWFSFFDDLIRREQLVSQDSDGWMIEKDLLSDLARDGFLRIEVACLNDQMYLGMARPDLFVRKPDTSFLVGYSKALMNIALMLMLIIVLGVTVSSIVKGPVALFFTLTFFIVGQFFHDFMMRILSGQEQGMGTLESAVLIAQHRNPQVGMDVSATTQAVLKGADKGLEGFIWGFSKIVPDFSLFNRGASFVENGFDVPFRECVVPAIAIFIGFLIPCVLIAGALLKFRELEAK